VRQAESWRSVVVAGVAASLVAGIPAGLAARVAMALIAAAGGSSMTAAVGELTLAGTMRILILPMVAGIPFALLLLAVGRRFTPGSWPVRMTAYGIGALVVPGLILLTDSEFNIPGPNRELGRWLFIPAFVIYGAVVGIVGEWLLRRNGSAVPVN
jgi:hypothetical protein